MSENFNTNNILQIHYYLEDQSHSINALVLNKAEAEILKIIEEIASVLDVGIITETQALEEGGIKSFYKFVSKKKFRKKATIVGVFIAGISANIIAEVVSEKLNTDPEMELLQKQELRLKIEKLKRELESTDDNINESNDVVAIIDDVSFYLSDSNRIKLLKSNFYKNVIKEEKVSQISTQVLDENQIPINEEKIISRIKFKDLIINEIEIEDDYERQVLIEIVAPVLTQKKIKWLGKLKGEELRFNMNDFDFKDLILKKNIKFSNGIKIKCDIQTRRKMNEKGDIINGAKSVYNVQQIIYPDGVKVEI